MPTPLIASMPAGIELQGSYIVRLAALDASGNAVANVNVSGVVITGRDLTGGTPPGEEGGPQALPPLFVPIPTDLPAEDGG